MSIVRTTRLAAPPFPGGSATAPARVTIDTFTFGRSRRSTTNSSRPFGSLPAWTDGAVKGRSSPSAGTFARSRVSGAAARCDPSGWNRTVARFGVSSQSATARRSESAVTARNRWRSSSTFPGSPRKTLYWFSTSALPPKPPMRSRPEMNSDSYFVFARSSSAGVGPSFASRAISCPITSSISAREAPGLAVAITMNRLAISLVALKAFTPVASCRS